MRAVLRFLVIAAVLIAAAWWVIDLPGTITMAIGDVNASAPTSVALLAFILFFVVVYVIVRLIALVLRLPSRTRRMRAERARRSGDTAVTRTLLALAGGDADGAQSNAGRARKLLGDTPQTLLLAAYAARQGGNTARADEIFAALVQRKDAAFLGLRGLYQGAVARGDWEAARALVAEAERVNPRAPWLRTEQQRLAIQSGSWQQALALGGTGAGAAALATAAAEEQTDPAQARRLAKQAFDADPAFTPGALAYARRLRAAGKEKAAQSVLRQSWSRNPHPDLGAMSLEAGGFMSRESRAEWLTQDTPQHAESLFLRAQAALEAGHLPQARSFAERSRDAGLDERRLWLLLAKVAADEGDAAGAADATRRAANSAPDSHWHCENCGTPYEGWQPSCSSCGEPGRIIWGGTMSRSGAKLLPAEAGYAILP